VEPRLDRDALSDGLDHFRRRRFHAPRTPFLKPGDTVHIEMLDAKGASIFGAIEQRVTSRR
jgi:hypothetical protein